MGRERKKEWKNINIDTANEIEREREEKSVIERPRKTKMKWNISRGRQTEKE
jgi:hypothetical protein